MLNIHFILRLAPLIDIQPLIPSPVIHSDIFWCFLNKKDAFLRKSKPFDCFPIFDWDLGSGLQSVFLQIHIIDFHFIELSGKKGKGRMINYDQNILKCSHTDKIFTVTEAMQLISREIKDLDFHFTCKSYPVRTNSYSFNALPLIIPFFQNKLFLSFRAWVTGQRLSLSLKMEMV